MPHVSIWLILVIACTTIGCSSGPVAPVLSDSRLYDNATEGFRILIPEGWVQISSSMLPPGKLDGEIFLVRYNLTTSEMGATFQVVCLDDKDSLNLEAHHTESSFRVVKWDVSEGRQSITINGVPAERMVYTAQADNRATTKIVTCFRKNGRVYSLIGVFWSNDENAKQQIERAIGDIIWEA